MYAKADLHLHTNASDGNYSPLELVNEALKKQLDIIAVTDHDTVKNIDEALKYNGDAIKIIPGMELSTINNGENIHILGYFRDDSYKCESFQKYLKNLADHRRKRADKIIENLKKYFNIIIDNKRVHALSKNVIARPHIAAAIIEAGYNYDFDYIFDNILNKDSPAYVPNKNVSITEGLELLKSVNALTVLAHPVLIKKTPIEDLMNYEFDGIEAKYSLNTPSDTQKFIKIAQKYNKIITAGSDCHGKDNDTKHGKIGCVYLNEAEIKLFLNKLKIENR